MQVNGNRPRAPSLPAARGQNAARRKRHNCIGARRNPGRLFETVPACPGIFNPVVNRPSPRCKRPRSGRRPVKTGESLRAHPVANSPYAGPNIVPCTGFTTPVLSGVAAFNRPILDAPSDMEWPGRGWSKLSLQLGTARQSSWSKMSKQFGVSWGSCCSTTATTKNCPACRWQEALQ